MKEVPPDAIEDASCPLELPHEVRQLGLFTGGVLAYLF